MRKYIIASVLLALGLSASAQIYVELPKQFKGKTILAQHGVLKQIAEARSEDDIILSLDSVAVKKHKAEIPLASEPSRYRIQIQPGSVMDIYASPGEKIKIKVTDVDPLSYSLVGSELMSGIELLDKDLQPIQVQYMEEVKALREGSSASEAKLEEFSRQFTQICKDFIARYPDSPAVAYAVSNLEGEDYLVAFDSMTEQARKSPLYPFVLAGYERQSKAVKAERATDAMINNHVEAPDFTLPDLQGNDVSLSSLRGKYVVVDFWGSWCMWCIKGFPELKKAYEQYSGSLEVIGVDCGDSPEAWKSAVEKYKLPWVNVYNNGRDKDAGILEQYHIQGFPTKVLVNPEGKIVTIAVGEDPAFYQILREVMDK